MIINWIYCCYWDFVDPMYWYIPIHYTCIVTLFIHIFSYIQIHIWEILLQRVSNNLMTYSTDVWQ